MYQEDIWHNLYHRISILNSMIYGKYKYFSQNFNNFEVRHAELFTTVSIRVFSGIFNLSWKPYTSFRTRASNASVLFSTDILLALQYLSYPRNLRNTLLYAISNCRYCLFVKSHQRNAVYMEPQYDINNWTLTSYEHEPNVLNNMFNFSYKFLNCRLMSLLSFKLLLITWPKYLYKYRLKRKEKNKSREEIFYQMKVFGFFFFWFFVKISCTKCFL